MATKPATQPVSFEELIARSLGAAEEAEALIQGVADIGGPLPGTVALAAIHATLSEAYARLASAVVVNRSSMHEALAGQQRGPRPS